MHCLGLLVALVFSLGGCGYNPSSETIPEAGSDPAAGTRVTPGPPQDGNFGIAVGDDARADRYALLVNSESALPPDRIGYFLDVHEGRLRQALAGTSIRMQRTGDRLLLTVPGRFSFETDSAEVLEAARPALAEIAAVLVEFDGTLVSVFGHTDDRGDPAYNQSLSERRALAVARFLARKGLARERLAGVGYGQRKPALEEDSESARTANRRIEILIEPITSNQ